MLNAGCLLPPRLKALGREWLPDLVLASNARRTRQTLEVMGKLDGTACSGSDESMMLRSSLFFCSGGVLDLPHVDQHLYGR